MTITNVVFCGDSITQGNMITGAAGYNVGGSGIWVQRWTAAYCKNRRLPLVGTGFQGLWLNSSPVRWSGMGSWTQVDSSSVFDKAVNSNSASTYAYFNSSGASLTITRLPNEPAWAAGGCIYWIDAAGIGDWQYKVDNGAWTNMAQTRLGDNKLKKLRFTTSATSSVMMRAFDGSANCSAIIVGFEGYFHSPSTTNGVIVHNLGCAGRALIDLNRPSSGDPLAWFDSVVLGTDAPDHKPNIVYMMYSNDLHRSTSVQWTNDLNAFWDRMRSISTNPVLISLNVYERGGLCLDGTQSTAEEQEEYRNRAVTAASTRGIPVFSAYRDWQRKYGGVFTPADGSVAASAIGGGALDVDTTHPTPQGHKDLARIAWWGE